MLRGLSGSFVQLLRRILRRFIEQFVGNSVGVVPAAHRDAMADPLADRVLWECHCPFLLAGLPERLPEALPRLDARTLPNVSYPPDERAFASDRNEVLFTFFTFIEPILQKLHQLRCDGNDALLVAYVVLSFG